MNIKRLYLATKDGIPLYTLKNGDRYRYINANNDGAEYTFVKHQEYEFPERFRINRRNIVSYQYKIAIPDSWGHQVVFVDETSLVQRLVFT